MKRTLIASIAFALTLSSANSLAAEAHAFTVLTGDRSTIDPAKDHYAVSLVSFWISGRDSFFRTIFSTTHSGAVNLSANAILFDADTTALNIQMVHDLKDVSGTVNQPVGLQSTLVESLPADANLKFKFEIAMYKGNRVGETLDALEKSKATLPADIFASPWFGYAHAASAVIDSLFSVSQTQYPFEFEGDVKAGVTAADGTMPSHYLILIAPSSGNDPTFRAIDQDKLAYDDLHGRVIYNGQPLTTWTHAVLKIAKAPPPNISALVFGSSSPWAQVAQTQVLSTPPSIYKTAAEIKSSADALYKSLQDVMTFLKKEPRFSKLDRALAMKAFADISVKHLRERCLAVKGTDASCGLTSLIDMSNTVDEIFGLAPQGARGTGVAIDPDLVSTSLKLQDVLLSHGPVTR